MEQAFIRHLKICGLVGALGLAGCANKGVDLPSRPLVVHVDDSSKRQEEESKTASESTSEDSNEFDEEEDDLMDDDWENELQSMSAPEIDYEAKDPLEKLNRVLYGVHRGVDLLFIRPVALTYSRALPKPLRSGVANFVSNLLAPARFFCHLLQGNWTEAGKTIGCFATNTLLGLGGLFDVAGKMNTHETPTDFTETLKKWGVKPGPYIVVPGLGPTTLRGALGFLLDSAADPVFLLTFNRGLPANSDRLLHQIDSAMHTTSTVISRSKIDSIYEDIEKHSVNRYSKLRALALQLPSNR